MCGRVGAQGLLLQSGRPLLMSNAFILHTGYHTAVATPQGQKSVTIDARQILRMIDTGLLT